ncbi:SDR family oxidoreductase [Streptomyces sp. NPDC050619]|uniref:SDR family oxidoreductase n=1 Tax=Streptomyces sp. NPDC050619 TaxID=3157214 RepID=UPI003439D97B
MGRRHARNLRPGGRSGEQRRGDRDDPNDVARAKLASRVPMKHIGDPTDIAEAAAHLCSEAAGYVTGVVLDVDGGMSIGSELH